MGRVPPDPILAHDRDREIHILCRVCHTWQGVGQVLVWLFSLASGASASDLVEVLDKAKSESLAPPIVALHQPEDKTVRAPTDVLEVAADYRSQIEAK